MMDDDGTLGLGHAGRYNPVFCKTISASATIKPILPIPCLCLLLMTGAASTLPAGL